MTLSHAKQPPKKPTTKLAPHSLMVGTALSQRSHVQRTAVFIRMAVIVLFPANHGGRRLIVTGLGLALCKQVIDLHPGRNG
ncbi:MAG: hypothetical protein HY539_06495 [Deltaproteobacteria bacterium]|nr:hypothetical protein [Deltaproteobacteria bacterium]MBI4197458.1 hypothetical protein [Deltaproteobacteria bacterium]